MHVWRIRLDAGADDDLLNALSPAEAAQAEAFALPALRSHYVAAHGMLRHILAHYTGLPAASLAFARGEFGKPMLANRESCEVAFNLSHSGSVALVALTGGGEVGVDVERWSDRVSHLDLASRVFSRAECAALSALSESPAEVRKGFYAAWTRKEAYMKATGHGISRGFDHFDVTLHPGEPARLLADRLDHSAPARWVMKPLDVGAGYSAALVAEAPLGEIRLFDAPPAGALHEGA